MTLPKFAHFEKLEEKLCSVKDGVAFKIFQYDGKAFKHTLTKHN